MKKLKKSVVFTMRMDAVTRRKLESLSANKYFRYNSSEVIRDLIETEHNKKFIQNETGNN
jgi:hypothetical protein